MGAPNFSNCGLYGCYSGGCYLGCTVSNGCAGTCYSGCAGTASGSNNNLQTLSCVGCVSGAYCKSNVRVDPATCEGLATS